MIIINALGNERINKKMEEESTGEDTIINIGYKEGIIELLEKNNSIDIIILNQLLPGEIKTEEIVEKIKSINRQTEIIVFLESKNNYLEKYLKEKNITNIFYNNEMTINNLIKIIEEIKINKKELKNEIEILEKIILNNNKNTNKKIYLFNKIKQIIINYLKRRNNKENKSKIINIVGNRKAGKTIVSIMIALSIKNKKILLMDFNLFNNNLYTIFQIKNISKNIKNKLNNNKKIELEDFIIKINKKINLLIGTEILLKNNIIDSINIKNEIKEFSKKYEYIIIDNQMENNVNILRNFFEIADSNIVVTEANLTELKETKEILKKCINELKIKRRNINILFNKYNKNSIDEKILKHLFLDFNIIGKIRYDKYYNLLINNNIKVVNKKIKNEFKKIIKTI